MRTVMNKVRRSIESNRKPRPYRPERPGNRRPRNVYQANHSVASILR